MNRVNISWEQIEELVDKVSEDINASAIFPEYLYAVDQQSLVFALMLSRKLDVPVTDNNRKNFTLFVSNFVDSGNSLARITEKSNCFVTATLFLKEGSKFSPDFVGSQKDKETYLCFPWDQKGKKVEPIASEDFGSIIEKIKGEEESNYI